VFFFCSKFSWSHRTSFVQHKHVLLAGLNALPLVRTSSRELVIMNYSHAFPDRSPNLQPTGPNYSNVSFVHVRCLCASVLRLACRLYATVFSRNQLLGVSENVSASIIKSWCDQWDRYTLHFTCMYILYNVEGRFFWNANLPRVRVSATSNWGRRCWDDYALFAQRYRQL
jgi:hypothetical protein